MSSSKSPPEAFRRIRDDPMLSETRKHLRSVQNVVGTGLGYKTREDEKTGEFAVIAYVDVKEPVAELPEAAVIPSELNGLPIDVRARGPNFGYCDSDNDGHEQSGSGEAGCREDKHRPIGGGLMVGGSGSLGMGVVGPNGNKGIISNAHLFIDNVCGSAPADYDGTTVDQPSSATSDSAIATIVDGGDNSDTDNPEGDFIYATLDDEADFTNEILGFGKVAAIDYPTIGEDEYVVGSGINPGFYGGEILAVDVEYTWDSCTYSGVIEFDTYGNPDMNGSSGSIVGSIDPETKEFTAMGMLTWATEDDNGKALTAFAQSVPKIQNYIGFTLDTGDYTFESDTPTHEDYFEIVQSWGDLDSVKFNVTNTGGSQVTQTVSITDEYNNQLTQDVTLDAWETEWVEFSWYGTFYSEGLHGATDQEAWDSFVNFSSDTWSVEADWAPAQSTNGAIEFEDDLILEYPGIYLSDVNDGVEEGAVSWSTYEDGSASVELLDDRWIIDVSGELSTTLGELYSEGGSNLNTSWYDTAVIDWQEHDSGDAICRFGVFGNPPDDDSIVEYNRDAGGWNLTTELDISSVDTDEHLAVQIEDDSGLSENTGYLDINSIRYIGKYRSSGSYTAAQKTISRPGVLHVGASVPTNTGLDVTIYQDTDGDGTAENSETVSVADGGSSIELSSFDLDSSDIWLEANFSSTDDTVSPRLEQATVEPVYSIVVEPTLGATQTSAPGPTTTSEIYRTVTPPLAVSNAIPHNPGVISGVSRTLLPSLSGTQSTSQAGTIATGVVVSIPSPLASTQSSGGTPSVTSPIYRTITTPLAGGSTASPGGTVTSVKNVLAGAGLVTTQASSPTTTTATQVFTSVTSPMSATQSTGPTPGATSEMYRTVAPSLAGTRASSPNGAITSERYISMSPGVAATEASSPLSTVATQLYVAVGSPLSSSQAWSGTNTVGTTAVQTILPSLGESAAASPSPNVGVVVSRLLAAPLSAPTTTSTPPTAISRITRTIQPATDISNSTSVVPTVYREVYRTISPALGGSQVASYRVTMTAAGEVVVTPLLSGSLSSTQSPTMTSEQFRLLTAPHSGSIAGSATPGVVGRIPITAAVPIGGTRATTPTPTVETIVTASIAPSLSLSQTVNLTLDGIFGSGVVSLSTPQSTTFGTALTPDVSVVFNTTMAAPGSYTETVAPQASVLTTIGALLSVPRSSPETTTYSATVYISTQGARGEMSIESSRNLLLPIGSTQSRFIIIRSNLNQ